MIKEYKRKTIIEMKDGERLFSESSIDDFFNHINKKEVVFIQIDNVIINKYEIKKIYEENINSITEFILSLPADTQKIVKKREEEMKQRVNKVFESVEQVALYIKNYYKKNEKK